MSNLDPRRKCKHSNCMANFQNECYVMCSIEKTIEQKMLAEIIEYVEACKQSVADSYGKGAVGALWGISEYLRERVTHQEAQR